MSILKNIVYKLKNNHISPKQVTNHYVSNIKEYNGKLNAFVHNTNYSEIADKDISNDLPYAGIPIAYKDNICTTGLPTTCCSKMLSNYYSPFNATVVERLSAKGFVTIGKTNMDEFAMGSATTTGVFGATKNPWSLQYGVGGSSGGSAAAVAARMVPIALGSDTGGSVRDPAHFCGVVGIKPSYGSISRYGLISYGSSLEQIGVLANFASDAAYILDTIGGKDENDQTTYNLSQNFFTKTLDKSLVGMSMGIDESLFQDLDLSLQSLIQHSIIKFQHAGVEVVNVKMPDLNNAVRAYYILATAEASTNFAKYDGIRFGGIELDKTKYDLETFYRKTRTEGFGSEVKKRIALGTYCLLGENYKTYFEQAQKYRRYLFNHLNNIYKSVDCIFLPTMAYTADQISTNIDNVYQSGGFTVLANLSGDPAITFPIGQSNNLPFSGQLMSKRLNDHIILNMVNIFQKYSDFHFEKPFIGGQTL